MANLKLEIGPVGERVAANLAALRASCGLHQAQLAKRMTDIGRPMSGAVVSKTEKLDRRIDVDDLVAFAVALGTTPNRLLLAALADQPDEIDLAPKSARVPTRTAWEWATGELPLSLPIHVTPRWSRPDPDTQSVQDEVWGEAWEEELRQFHQENRPHSDELSGADISAAMRELDNHPDVMKQAIALIHIANREGILESALLIAAIDLANFIVQNEIDKS
jgi:transcriptional regulator with XRE-family HTH domain